MCTQLLLVQCSMSARLRMRMLHCEEERRHMMEYAAYSSSPPHNHNGGGGCSILLPLSSLWWRRHPIPHPPSVFHHGQDVVEHDVYSILSRRGEVGGVLLLTSSPSRNGVHIMLLIFVMEDSAVYSIMGRRRGVLLLSSSWWRRQPNPPGPQSALHQHGQDVKEYDAYSIRRRRGEVDGILLLSSLWWSVHHAPHHCDGGYSLLARTAPPVLLFSLWWSPRHTPHLPQPWHCIEWHALSAIANILSTKNM